MQEEKQLLIGLFLHENMTIYILYHAVYQKQALLTVCWMKESWIEAENDKCGGNLSPTRLYKKPTTVLWVNIRMNISKFQGMGFVHFIYGQCLFLKS